MAYANNMNGGSMQGMISSKSPLRINNPLANPNYNNTSTFSTFTPNNNSRSSPVRSRTKAIGSTNQTSNYFPQPNYSSNLNSIQNYNNPRSLPIGVSVYGSSILKNNAVNGEPFLPRMTPKQSQVSTLSSFEENALPGHNIGKA
jgi:hypothetical protein